MHPRKVDGLDERAQWHRRLDRLGSCIDWVKQFGYDPIWFGVILVVEKGHQFQVATFRAEADYQDGRRPERVSFGDAMADQTFAELAGAGVRRRQRLGFAQIVPCGSGIRLLQEPFAALDISPSQLAEQFPGLLMPAHGRLVEELLGLFEAAVLQRRPDLSQG